MKTIESLREYLLANHVDRDGDLILSYLDFSGFYGDVFIGEMKVKGNLIQSGQDVGCTLYQSRSTAKGNLFNENNKYGGVLYEKPSTKLLKEITYEELAELGYQLKEES